MVDGLTAWFYSSLAQVSASIFGVIGAVFAARMADYVQKARDSFDVIQRDSIDPTSHNLGASKQTIEQVELLNKNDVPSSDRELLRVAATRYAAVIGGPVTLEGTSNLLHELRALRSKAQHPWTLEQLENPIRWLEQAAQRVEHFQKMVFPLSLWAVWGLLAWLACVGVIWPMSALPGIPGSWFYSNTLILGLFGAGTILFVVFLLIELLRLWRLGRQFVWRVN